MKATVTVRLKTEVLDPQGDAVQRTLGKLGFTGIKGVRIGKIVEIELDEAEAGDKAALATKLRTMADELLANPVIEEFDVQV